MLSRLIVIGCIALTPFFSSCSSPTAMQYGSIGVGSAAGAGAGYALSDGNEAVTAGGAILGGLFGHFMHNKNMEIAQENYEQGYMQGASDAVKRHYWSKANQHKSDEPDYTYYETPGIENLSDGTKRIPHSVIIQDQ